MRTIIFGVAMTDELKPLATQKTIATFTLTASHKNTQDLPALGRQDGPIEVAPGTQYYFERVNLADILVKSKGGGWSLWSATAPGERVSDGNQARHGGRPRSTRSAVRAARVRGRRWATRGT